MIAVVWRGMRLDAEAQMNRLAALRSELQTELMVSMVRKIDRLDQSLAFQNLDDELRKLVLVQVRLAEQQLQKTDAIGAQIEGLSADGDQRHLEIMDQFSRLTPSPVNASGDTYEEQAARIKETIWFSAIQRRHGAIQAAHRSTFEWIFEGQQTTPESNTTLVEWMAAPRGLYWVSGRAGTGKSSLMRFLDDDPRTRPLFQEWAGTRPLRLASFYFWNSEAAGDDRLKSLSGLYRAIIFSLIDQDESLAQIMFPGHMGKGKKWDGNFPTLIDMTFAFEKLATTKDMPVAVGLIIDGLDEFDAPSVEQRKLAELLCKAAESPNLKIIVSSRPEDAFEQAFTHSKKIRLHQLTEKDRRIVVTDELNSALRLARITTKLERDELIETIVARSEGIFLWLTLAVQTMIQEIDVALDAHNLLQVAKDIPSGGEELAKTFDHMLRKRIPSQYQALGLGLIETLRYGYSLAPKMIPWVERGQPAHPISTVLCSFFEQDVSTTLDLAVQVMDVSERTLREEMATSIIRRSCAGLLESRSHADDSGVVEEVHYLHKDVGIYLHQKDTQEYIAKSLATPGRGLQTNLLKCVLSTIKTRTYAPHSMANTWDGLHFWENIEHCMRIGRDAEASDPETVEALLDSLDKAMQRIHSLRKDEVSVDSEKPVSWPSYWTWEFPIDPHHRTSGGISSSLACLSFMSFAVQHDLCQYVILKLRKGESIRRKNEERPLLSSACGADPIWWLLPQRRPSKVVKALLEHGANPNEAFRGMTAWQTALDNARRARMSFVELSEMATILELLIRAGADVQCPVEWTTRERIGKRQWKTQQHSRMAHEQIYATFIAKDTDEPGSYHDLLGLEEELTDEESATIKKRGEQLLSLLDKGKPFRGRFLRQVRRGQTYILKKIQARYPTSQN
jgi:NACHT domain-containing protein